LPLLPQVIGAMTPLPVRANSAQRQWLDEVPSLDRDEQVACIRLNRPGRHNRLQPEDVVVVRELLQACKADESIRVLIVAASGDSFSSGFDLSSWGSTTQTPGEPPQVVLQRLCDELEAFPRPTVCAINGGVYGGAVDLALACDFRIGVRRATLRMGAAQLGLCFYPSGLQRFVTRLGLATSKRLFLGGEQYAGQDLLHIGFLDEVVDDEEALARAAANLARRIALLPPVAAAYTKESLNQVARGTPETEEGNRAFRRSLDSEEFERAVQAWSQRK
jgi:enoyl-CoA hydratase/carnithine racemase